jgi:hypothetical protein
MLSSLFQPYAAFQRICRGQICSQQILRSDPAPSAGLLMVVHGPAPPEEVEPRLDVLTTFLDLVPDHLLNRF